MNDFMNETCISDMNYVYDSHEFMNLLKNLNNLSLILKHRYVIDMKFLSSFCDNFD
jgi:hypothetical protein